MTNEEKAREIADKHKQQCYYAAHGDLDPSFEECYQSALQAMQWKDKQFAKEKQQWIDVSDELPPFVATEDGNQYSNQVFCKEKCGNYCVARFVRWPYGTLYLA